MAGTAGKRHPTEIDLGLDRVAEVYKRLGNVLFIGSTLVDSTLVDSNFAGGKLADCVVSVAGTNGKGSCVATLAALLQSAGLNVATYTSPHLLHFNERITLNGQPVTDACLIDAFEKVEKARQQTSLTYFEFTTLAAFAIMAESAVDVAILEVGLGGRLDAVNIIDADIAIITSIDLDHSEYLGNTRESVAAEKLGIARRNRPLLCGETDLPSNFVAEVARYGCEALYLGKDFHLADNLAADHLPAPSVACALKAAELLAVDLSVDELSCVLSQLHLPGRFQRITIGDRQLILDVAHNPAAAELLAARLPDNCQAVVAMMADKDMAGVLAPLAPVFDHWFLPALADIPRAAPPSDVRQLLYNGGHSASEADSVGSAIEQALERADAGGTVVVFGSFFTVAAACSGCNSTGAASP